jgi:hypothetical protein
MLRLSHILTTAALVAVCAAPASAVSSEQLHSGDRDDAATKAAADTGFRTSYQPVPPSKTGQGQDLRSPDAADAAQHRGLYASDRGAYVLNRDYGSPDAVDAARNAPSYVLNRDYGSPDAVDAAGPRTIHERPFVLNRDYGSPDAVDAARTLPPVQIPVVEVRDVPSSGFDWGDAGIGAAGMLALFSIAAGSALMLTGRKRRHGIA